MILLVTKNKNLMATFQDDLEQEGFQVELVNDYKDVFFRLHQKQLYKMVILDFESSRKEATELCQKLKNNQKYKYLPLICIVQKDLVVEQLIAFELGADEFIFVPYTTPELQLKMRSIERLLELQNQLKEKENELNSLTQVQQILITLSHHINNSLTPLYTLVQMIDEENAADARRLKDFSKRTVEFIQKVLTTLNTLVRSGEMKVVQKGIYKNLLLDIEAELKKLQDNSK